MTEQLLKLSSNTHSSWMMVIDGKKEKKKKRKKEKEKRKREKRLFKMRWQCYLWILYGIDSAIACGEKNDKRQSLVNGNIKKEGKSLNNSKNKEETKWIINANLHSVPFWCWVEFLGNPRINREETNEENAKRGRKRTIKKKKIWIWCLVFPKWRVMTRHENVWFGKHKIRNYEKNIIVIIMWISMGWLFMVGFERTIKNF